MRKTRYSQITSCYEKTQNPLVLKTGAITGFLDP